MAHAERNRHVRCKYHVGNQALLIIGPGTLEPALCGQLSLQFRYSDSQMSKHDVISLGNTFYVT